MAGIWIEVGLQELGLKLSYRNWDRSWVTGIEFKVGDRNWDRSWVKGIGINVEFQELRPNLVTGTEIEKSLFW